MRSYRYMGTVIGGVQISTGEPVRFCRATNRILAD